MGTCPGWVLDWPLFSGSRLVDNNVGPWFSINGQHVSFRSDSLPQQIHHLVFSLCRTVKEGFVLQRQSKWLVSARLPSPFSPCLTEGHRINDPGRSERIRAFRLGSVSSSSQELLEGQYEAASTQHQRGQPSRKSRQIVTRVIARLPLTLLGLHDSARCFPECVFGA